MEDSLGDHLSLLSLLQAINLIAKPKLVFTKSVKYENLNNCVKNAQILANN